MATPTPPMAFTPTQPSPLARTTSPFKHPRPAPSSTSAKTAKLWDEYEKVAVDNARKRSRTAQTPCYPPSLPSDKDHASRAVREAYQSSANTRPRRTHAATPSTTVAICGTCKQPITFSSGICERCKKTIIMSTPKKSTVVAESSRVTARDPTSTGFHLMHSNSSTEEANIPTPTPSKQQSYCPVPTQFANPPIRLSSLRPPPSQETPLEPSRSRKVSLTDPNEPFLRLQISKHLAHAPSPYSNPSTPTFNNMPTTPPSTSHSHASTRPSSLANTAAFSTYPYARNNSATPSELSTLCPYASTTTTSPPSLSRVSYAVQNTTSAWDDWDSDGEGEKMRLVAWMGRRKDKGRRDKGSNKASVESLESEVAGAVGAERKKVDKGKRSEQERLQQARREMVELVRASKMESVAAPAEETKRKKKRRPSGFMRVISCGCSRE